MESSGEPNECTRVTCSDTSQCQNVKAKRVTNRTETLAEEEQTPGADKQVAVYGHDNKNSQIITT